MQSRYRENSGVPVTPLNILLLLVFASFLFGAFCMALSEEKALRDSGDIKYIRSARFTGEELFTLMLLLDEIGLGESFNRGSSSADGPQRPRQLIVRDTFDQGLAEFLQCAKSTTSLNLYTFGASSRRRVVSLSPLRFFPSLSWLSLQDNHVKNISPLGDLQYLKHLNLDRNRIESIAPLGACKRLEYLRVGDNPIEDLSALEHLNDLGCLELSGSYIDAFCQVERIASVRRVSFSPSAHVTSLSALPEMPDLRVLLGVVTDSLNGIERYPELRNIEVSGEFEDLSAFCVLTNLTDLQIKGSLIQDVEGLNSFHSLKFLYLDSRKDLTVNPHWLREELLDVRIIAKGDSVVKHETPVTSKEVDALFSSVPMASKGDITLTTTTGDVESEVVKIREANGDQWDGDEALLDLETRWIASRIRAVAPELFDNSDDFLFSTEDLYGRPTRTIRVDPMTSVGERRIPAIVASIHRVLSVARNRWVLVSEVDYAEHGSDGFFFILGRTNVVTTAEAASHVTGILSQAGLRSVPMTDNGSRSN